MESMSVRSISWKCFDHSEKDVRFRVIHAVDLVVKVEILDDFPCAGRKAVDESPEIDSHVIGVGDQFAEIELAPVVEVEAGNFI
jgi:hypothetical protein